MKKSKTISLLLAAALVVGGAGVVLAGEGGPPPRQDRKERRGADRYEWDGDRGYGPHCRMGDRCDGDEWQGRGPGMGRQGPRHGDDRFGPGMGMRMGPGMGMGMGMGPGMGMRMGPGMGMGYGMRVFEDLNLTPEQKTQMLDAITANFRARLEARLNMMEAMKKLHDVYGKDGAADAEIIAANQAVGEAKGKLDVLRKNGMDKFKAILTPEQAKILEDRFDSRFKGRDLDDQPVPGGRRGPGMRPGPEMRHGPGPQR